MLAIIMGILLISIGLGWSLVTFFAAGMASRTVTAWESTWRPALGLIAAALGIAIIVWG